MLANFEKIRKYILDDPAWCNNIVHDLQTKYIASLLTSSNNKDKASIAYLQHYLEYSKGNLEELKQKLGIKITKHPELPLMIFNYDHVLTPHDSLIGLECRGIVLECETWKMVAKPMYRFFNWGEIEIDKALHPNMDKGQFDFNNFVTQSKEDGSLMVLFYYNNNWMLNTRSYFLNNVDKAKVIMSGIHEIYANEVIKIFISSLNNKNIKSLNDLDQYLDRNFTYCFEFCTKPNKIVRTYEEDTVFLLTITSNTTFKEAENHEVDELAKIIGAKRPKVYNLKTFEEILNAMKEMVIKDPSLEGFVIRDKNATRWKIKSPSYFFLHHISYDKLRTPYPKDLVHLILQGEGTELFSILEINGFTAELYEVQKQWEFCEKRLKEGWLDLKADWKNMINIKDDKDYEKVFKTFETPLISYLEELYQEKKFKLEDLEAKWYSNPQYLVENLFAPKEQNPINMRKSELIITHISQYKKNVKPKYVVNPEIFKKKYWWRGLEDINDGLAKQKPNFKDGKWVVYCHCGNQMNLFSVPEYWYQYKCIRAPNCIYCQDSIIEKKKVQGKLVEKSGGSNPILTYQCLGCGLSHRAHQHEKKIMTELKRRPLKGKPLGIPCSDLCLALRHRVHEEMDILAENFKWDRDTIYLEASKILDVNTEYAHVGMLGISQCIKLIDGFAEMRGSADDDVQYFLKTLKFSFSFNNYTIPFVFLYLHNQEQIKKLLLFRKDYLQWCKDYPRVKLAAFLNWIMPNSNELLITHDFDMDGTKKSQINNGLRDLSYIQSMNF